MRALLFALSAALALPSGATVLEVPLRIEPPQAISAIVIRSDDVLPVPVRNGKVFVPAEVPLPWTLGLTRFEATTYTQSDLGASKPLLVRELGVLRGTIRRPSATNGERFTWLLLRNGSDSAQEIDFMVDADGSFQIALGGGIYQGAVLGASSASRVRSGILVRPGQPTDLRVVSCEPAAPSPARCSSRNCGG